MNQTLPVLLLLACMSCGSDDSSGVTDQSQPTNPNSPGQSTNPGGGAQIVDSVTPQEREKYCFLRIDSATTEEKQTFVKNIEGTWTHYPANGDAGYRKREFHFDPNVPVAAITEYLWLGKNVDSMGFKKICLSAVLGENYGPYAGYRILELLANNNEGAAAAFIKWESTAGQNPVLYLSDRHYGRYSADSLIDPQNVVKSDSIKKIWVYRERK